MELLLSKSIVLSLVYEKAIEELLLLYPCLSGYYLYLIMQYDELDVAFTSKEIIILDTSMPLRRDGKH